MTDQAFTLVPVERLDRMESLLRDLASRLEGATVTPAPEWLTLNEYAKRIGKTRRTVKNWKDAGKLETKIENGETLVRVSPGVYLNPPFSYAAHLRPVTIPSPH